MINEVAKIIIAMFLANVIAQSTKVLISKIKYKEVFPEPYEIGGSRLKTFAEYLGKENSTLEAHRKELWGK